MGVSPDDSSVVIGYQVDDCTHTRSTEHLVAQSHIYPVFTGKVATQTHFLLELTCEDYSILDQAFADLDHGSDSIHTDCQNTATGCIL